MNNIKKTLSNLLFILISLLTIVSCRNQPESKEILLENVENPLQVFSSEEKLYITCGSQGTKVQQYLTPSLTYSNTFAQYGLDSSKLIANAGEGTHVSGYQEKVFVSSFWKVTEYGNNGIAEKEIKGMPNHFFYEKTPKGFVGIGYKESDGTGYYSVNLYNDSLKLLKEMYMVENSYNPNIGNRVLTKEYGFCIADNKIFAKGKTDDYTIDVFSIDGKYLYQIEKDYDRLPVEQDNKDAILDFYRLNPNFKDFYEEITKDIIFPDSLPAINQIKATEKYLYIITNKVVKEKTELHVLSHDGSLVKKCYIPIKWANANIISSFTIQGGYVYQLFQQDTIFYLKSIYLDYENS